MNVLMVGTQLSCGGAGRIAELLAVGLRRAGHTVCAFVRDNPTADPACRQVRHWRLGFLQQWLSRAGLPDLGDLASFLWRCRAEYAAADVVHLHNLHGDYLSLLALPLWGRDKPLVWTLHDAWPLTGNCAYPRDCPRWRAGCGRCPQLGLYPQGDVDHSRFYRWLKPRLAAAARPALLPSSAWLARQVQCVPELARLPMRVVPNPVDTSIFAPARARVALRRGFGLAPTAPTVAVVGCLYSDPRKNAPDAVRALRRVAEHLPGLQMLAVAPTARRLLAAAGVPGRALPFLQDRAALAQAYACADVCLFPSRADNYPMTVLESMSCGTPVVAYAAGGVPEQIEHGQTGWLAADGDVDGLVAGLRATAGSPATARRWGVAARTFIERTAAMDVVVAQFEREYRRAIAAWRRRTGRTTARFGRSRLARVMARLLEWDAHVQQSRTVQESKPVPPLPRTSDRPGAPAPALLRVRRPDLVEVPR
ncbi:MAG: glycosyltransferase [Planctomycetota bacterium]